MGTEKSSQMGVKFSKDSEIVSAMILDSFFEGVFSFRAFMLLRDLSVGVL